MVDQADANTLPMAQRHWFKPMLLLLALFVVVFLITVVVVDARRAKQPKDSLASLTAGSSSQSTVATLPVVNRSVNPQLETKDDPSLGPTTAPVVVVMFIDFQCPYCRQMFSTFREVAVAYSNRVRFILRDFPVTQLHEQAQASSEAAACVYTLGGNERFWSYHDKLYLNQDELGPDLYRTLAVQVGVDEAAYTRCVESRQTQAEVDADFLDGVALGVTGTPTFFFNGYRVQGVIPKESFTKVLDLLLTE